jgi:hypothetical protein
MKITSILLILIVSLRCYGFSSVIGNQSRDGYDIHSKISHSIIDELGFNYISFRMILSGIISADYYKDLVNNSDMHCDRNRNVSHNQALLNCQKKFRLLLTMARTFIKKKKYFKSLYKLGQALHIAQDLISHSNISLLKPKIQTKLLREFLEGRKINTISQLKITYWDHRDKTKKDNFKKDKYSHKHFCLDHPTKNDFGKKIHKDDGKRTQFEIAFRIARIVTRRVIKLYLLDLNDKELKIIKSYNI